MVIRTFFDKNNTVIYGDTTNTGKNPVTELFYGGYNPNTGPYDNSSGGTANLDLKFFSRFIFHFDESKIRGLHDDAIFCDISKLTHKIKMTNTGFFDDELLGKTTCSGKKRANSFDLLIYPLDQHWDEGVGYDYNDNHFIGYDASVTSDNASNWTEAKTITPWSGSSMYTGYNVPAGSVLQHFEDGNENLEIDVTNLVNNIITGDTNYGFGLAFIPQLEELNTNNDLQYVGFFTRHTQTFYEPFLETTYDNTIRDDRSNFYLDKINKIYLYSNVGGQPTPLDYLPELTITDGNGDIITTYSSNTLSCDGVSMTGSVVSNISCVSKGVYSAEVFIPSSDYPDGDCIDFTDTWSNICINGIKRPDVELSFIIKDPLGYYNIGDNDDLPINHAIKVTGIKHGEKINRGDIRRVNVIARIPYTINQSDIIDGLEYRLYVKEGRNQYTVIDYTEIHRAHNGNYFHIDTDSLIPNTYFLDIKIKSHNEVTTLNEALKFDIVSQSEFRISQ